MLWVILVGIMGWMTLTAMLDRPQYPAWQVRNVYRWLNAGLVVLLLLVAYKALMYREELRLMLRICH